MLKLLDNWPPFIVHVSRVVPEYSRSLEEPDILENAFQIVFAFDEIVALGYRENVNLAQIRYHSGFNEQ